MSLYVYYAISFHLHRYFYWGFNAPVGFQLLHLIARRMKN